MRLVTLFAAALAFLAFSAGPSFAQKEGSAAPTLTASDYLGSWSGAIDWRGVEGYDNAAARWELRPDGTFLDDYGDVGAWSVAADGSFSLRYNTGGQARYSGIIMGGLLFGTMVTADGNYSGAFAMHR